MNCKLYYVFILQELIQVFHWVFFEKGWALWGWGLVYFTISFQRIKTFMVRVTAASGTWNLSASCWLESGIPVAAEQANLFFKPGSHPQEVREVMEDSDLTLGSVWWSGCTDIIITFVWVCCHHLFAEDKPGCFVGFSKQLYEAATLSKK